MPLWREKRAKTPHSVSSDEYSEIIFDNVVREHSLVSPSSRIDASEFVVQFYHFFFGILRLTMLYFMILYPTVFLYSTILYYTILYYTILYYTILYYTILYYTILYYTFLHCIILCYTVL